MTEIEFIHAQFKTPVVVYRELVFAVLYAPAMKSVVLTATGGAAIPVEGSLEQVKAKINGQSIAHNQGEAEDGISISTTER
jgi:hypothetical protein